MLAGACGPGVRLWRMPRPLPELNQLLAKGAVLAPEYGTIRTATAVFGLSRTEFFRLIAQGKIHSVHYLKKGARKGIRLIHFGSVRDYLESFA